MVALKDLVAISNGSACMSQHYVASHVLTASLRSMLDWSQCAAGERVPGKVSGAWLFRGTRVPVEALFANLEDGVSVDEFLAWFPGPTREQVLAVLRFAEASLSVAP